LNCRTYDRLVESLSPTSQGLGESQSQRSPSNSLPSASCCESYAILDEVPGRTLSKEIRRSVKEDGHPVEANVVRPDPTAQDFGSTLVLALGTPAIIYLARAILEWAKRTNNSVIELNGVRIERVESCDVADVVAALNAPSKRSGHGKE
jgi:hypothetical protein